jgi:hypothetical protein
MAEHAQSAETPAQLLNIGIIIISRSALFSGDTHKWHDKPTRDKTCPCLRPTSKKRKGPSRKVSQS